MKQKSNIFSWNETLQSLYADNNLNGNMNIKIGSRVSHEIYGDGTVLGNRHERNDGSFYLHIQYDDGTFGYAKESGLKPLE